MSYAINGVNLIRNRPNGFRKVAYVWLINNLTKVTYAYSCITATSYGIKETGVDEARKE